MYQEQSSFRRPQIHLKLIFHHHLDNQMSLWPDSNLPNILPVPPPTSTNNTTATNNVNGNQQQQNNNGGLEVITDYSPDWSYTEVRGFDD